jgi:hypothetical protein
MLGKSTLLGIVVGVAAISSYAWADPLPGEQLKFFQSPLDANASGIYPVGATPNPATDKPTAFYPGQDILSTASPSPASGGYAGTMAADDFSDTNPLPIGHITWWGSYLNGTTPPVGALQQFQVSLYTNSSGAPGALIATQTLTQTTGPLTSSSGTFTQSAPIADPGSTDGPLYQYNGELNWKQITFPDAVYPTVEWLSIVALVPDTVGTTTPEYQWGWHDRDWGIKDPFAAPGDTTVAPFDYHFMDDAVSGFYPPANSGYSELFYNGSSDGQFTSMDLAFALYTIPVPEPVALPLLVGGVFLLQRRRRATKCR